MTSAELRPPGSFQALCARLDEAAFPEAPRGSTEDRVIPMLARVARLMAKRVRLVEGATYSNARLAEVSGLQGVIGLVLTGGAGLSGADLTGVDLTGASLPGVTAKGAILAGAVLNAADLSEADLSAADLAGADLKDANLGGATMFRANLSGARLPGANLTRANLSKADLTRAHLDGANATGASLAGATLSAAILARVRWTAETQWPGALGDMRLRSDEIAPGVWQVRPEPGRRAPRRQPRVTT